MLRVPRSGFVQKMLQRSAFTMLFIDVDFYFLFGFEIIASAFITLVDIMTLPGTAGFGFGRGCKDKKKDQGQV